MFAQLVWELDDLGIYKKFAEKVKQWRERLITELQEFQDRVELRNRYDTELSLKTNLRLFEQDWMQLKQQLEKVFKMSGTKEIGE